jgi:predicted protein tyrosine phosphatase
MNRQRSKTAEKIFLTDNRFESKSAGIDKYAKNPINREIIEWADYIFTMEEKHISFIKDNFKDIIFNKKIECLNIKDKYFYMDEDLVLILKEKINNFFNNISEVSNK